VAQKGAAQRVRRQKKRALKTSQQERKTIPDRFLQVVSAALSMVKQTSSKVKILTDPSTPIEILESVGRDPLSVVTSRFEVLKPQIIEEKDELDEKQRAAQLEAARGLVRGIFSADRPFRTKVNLHGVVNTSAGGGCATTFSVSNVSTATEVSTLGLLFDQVFVHSMMFSAFPPNTAALGKPTAGASTTQIVQTTGAGLVTNDVWMVVAAYFGTNGAPATATAVSTNPNHRYVSQVTPWKYLWRNNVRYDPRGESLTLASAGWQGWLDFGALADIGGLIHMRAINDTAIGDGSHAVTMFQYVATWDLSWRCRI